MDPICGDDPVSAAHSDTRAYANCHSDTRATRADGHAGATHAHTHTNAVTGAQKSGCYSRPRLSEADLDRDGQR